MKLLGKRALVTGAARGIGRGCAFELARAGADVAINDRERTPQVEAVVAEIQDLGRHAVLVDGSVFERPSCESVVSRAISAMGRIDIFVSNPALQRRADFLDFDPETFAKVIEGTLAGGFHMSQLVARHMVERGGGGKIVNIGSMTSIFGSPFASAYAATKGGIVQLTKSLALAWAKDNIQVNSILPGWFDTELTEKAREEIPGLHERVLSRIPQGRWAKPADMAGTAVWLASSASDYVTGVAIPVDGGYASSL